MQPDRPRSHLHRTRRDLQSHSWQPAREGLRPHEDGEQPDEGELEEKLGVVPLGHPHCYRERLMQHLIAQVSFTDMVE